MFNWRYRQIPSIWSSGFSCSTFIFIPWRVNVSLSLKSLLNGEMTKTKPIFPNDSDLALRQEIVGELSLGQFDVISSSNNIFFSRSPSWSLTGFWMTTLWITCESRYANGFLITSKITVSSLKGACFHSSWNFSLCFNDSLSAGCYGLGFSFEAREVDC